MVLINLSHGDDEEYEVMDGAVITENLSENLDSLTVVIPQLSGGLTIEPYDMIQIIDNEGNETYWLVADSNKNYVSFQPNEKFNYTIDLMSFAKWFETIQLPNMAITNIGQNRTIKSYVERVVNRYLIPSLKKSVYDDEAPSEVYVNLNGIPNDVVCPEYTFQSPTLREYLDALFSKFGGIAKLVMDGRTEDFDDDYGYYYKYYFSIEVFYLTKITTPINTEYLNDLVETQTAEDYVTALSHSIEDVIGQESVTEYQKFKSEDYLMDTNNACILLNQKPYDIDKIEILNYNFALKVQLKTDYLYQGDYITIDDGRIWFSSSVNTPTWITGYGVSNIPHKAIKTLGIVFPLNALNITPNLVTRDVFESLSQIADLYGETGSTYTQYFDTLLKNNTFFWERGTKKIDGLLNYDKKQVLWWSSSVEVVKTASVLAFIRYLKDNPSFLSFYDSDYGTTWYIDAIGDFIDSVYYTYSIIDEHEETTYEYFPSYQDLKFKITYKPYMNARFEIEDGEKNSHHVVMQDNSTNASTDIGQYLAQSVEKNMKLGNPTLIATARVPVNNSDEYSLGQYYQKGNDRYILSTLEKQLKSNETLFKFTLTKNFTNRNLNTIINREKRYYALAKDEIVERSEIAKKSYINISLVANESSIDSGNNHNIFYQWFAPTNPNGYNMLDFATYKVDGGAKIVGGTIPLNTIIGGNSVIYSASFMDNINYKLSNAGEVTGGYAMQYYKYTDDNGEFASINCNIVNVANESNLINQAEVGHPSLEVSFLKDQREKITINLEYIYKSTDTRLKIGSHFAEAVVKKTNITIYTYLYYTDGTYVHKYTNTTGIPDRWYIPDNAWYKNNNQDHVQAIVQTTTTGEDVLIIYNPPRGIYLSATQVDETY